MLSPYDKKAPKKLEKLSLNSDLLKQAKDLKINIIAVFEQALVQQVKTKSREIWRKNDKKVLRALNDPKSKNTLFPESYREF